MKDKLFNLRVPHFLCFSKGAALKTTTVREQQPRTHHKGAAILQTQPGFKYFQFKVLKFRENIFIWAIGHDAFILSKVYKSQYGNAKPISHEWYGNNK